jgi:hypothetical protein
MPDVTMTGHSPAAGALVAGKLAGRWVGRPATGRGKTVRAEISCDGPERQPCGPRGGHPHAEMTSPVRHTAG